jgi:hypothetical protein
MSVWQRHGGPWWWLCSRLRPERQVRWTSARLLFGGITAVTKAAARNPETAIAVHFILPGGTEPDQPGIDEVTGADVQRQRDDEDVAGLGGLLQAAI